MSPTKLLKRTYVRLGVLYLSLFIIATVMGMLLASYLIDRNLRSRLDHLVIEQFSFISSQYNSDDPQKLVKLVNDHIRLTRDMRNIYQLMDSNGELLAGNTSVTLTSKGLNRVHAHELKISDDVHYSVMTGQVGNMSLWVGQSSEETIQIKSYLSDAAMASVLASTFMVLFSTMFLAGRFQERLDTTKTALHAVSQGKLDLRLPVSDRSDDIDSISISINKMLDELQATISAIDESSTNIAHDLRGPISRVFMDLDDALRKFERGDNVSFELESAQNELSGITRTFDSLLRIARVETRTRKSQFRQIDISALLASMHESYLPVAEEKSMDLVLEMQDSDPVIVIGDEGLLSQLVVNLIENALRYCPDGSTIRLGLCQYDNQVEMRVTDNGMGIPEDERDKVFQRLYRVESSRSEPGSGLGLSLVRAIINLHDGSVKLADAQPGLAVIVLLPLA